MEKNKLSVKWMGIIAAVVVVLASVTIFAVVHFTKSDDTYRTIQIYELKGSAVIEREDIGSMAAVENLYLISGDRIIVDTGSYMRLKIDDDKYIMVEEDTILYIVAEGTKDKSRTSIKLEQGAITNEIQNKLNDDSSYEVTTPNSVMAVRGTVFRVALNYDEKSEVYTKVATFEGKVTSRLILPDGTQQDVTVFVEDGKEVIIHMDTVSTEYLTEPQDIEYNELPTDTLEFLQNIAESGTELTGITLEKIEELIEVLSDRNEENTVDETTTQQSEPVSETVIESEAEPESKTESESEAEPESKTEPESEAEPESKSEAESESEAESKSEAESESESESETETESQPETESESESESVSETESESQTEETKKCTVTFTYNGAVFGTQTVEAGKTISAPRLSPSTSGEWDYDFSKPVTEDIVINWKYDYI